MEADESTANDNSSEPKKKGLLDGPILGSKGENIIKRILLIIPRLIATLVRSIKKKWDNRKSQQLIKRIEFLENLTQDQKKQLTELQGGLDKTNQEVNDAYTVIDDMKKRHASYHDLIDNELRDINSKLDSTNKQIDDIHKNNRSINNSIGELYDDISDIKYVIDFMNGTVHTEMNFDTAKSYLQDVLKMIGVLANFDPFKPSSIGKDVMNKLNADVNARGYVKYDLMIYDKKHVYKFSDVKRYVKELSDLRDQITDKGSKLVEKITKIATDLNKAYEGKKETEGRQNTVNTCQTVLKYAQRLALEGQRIDSFVTTAFNNLNSMMKLVQTRLNKGFAEY